VEALFGLGRRDEAEKAFDEAKAMQPPPDQWMIDSTGLQLQKLDKLLQAA
jgi:hypothetical protein